MKYKIRRVTSLPRNLPQLRGCVLQCDVKIKTLRAKVVVFKTNRDLRAFWAKYLDNSLCRFTLGAVNTLGYTTESAWTDKGEPMNLTLQVDQHYFCVIGLLAKHLTMEIITHESVHAAFAYARRRGRAAWRKKAQEFDEESICYPAGEISRQIVTNLIKAKLVD